MDKIAMLGEILQQNPTDAFARYGLAMAYVSEQKLDAAFAEFARLVELNPDYVPGYQMYAQTLATAGRTDEAVAMLRRGIDCATRVNNQHALAEMQQLLDEIGGTP
ncbi:MAG TPA: tetratricopeptide repeat protein [Acidobacteriaceae bacterium]